MSQLEVVSVLITDLVGSTALTFRVGPGAADELQRQYFSLLRGAINEASGREVKNLGDGLMAVFASPSMALDAAVGIQQRIEQRNRRVEEQLWVRIGISLGEATREEDDYFGIPVIEATRLCALAEGGQILTTDTVRLMAGRGEHRFTSLGALELKGVPEPVPSCELEWERLDPSADALPLPARLREAPPTGYVGRAAEREQLERLLEDARSGERRVALLSGEPGIGKTRLATLTAIEARGSGATVLYGRCEEDVGIPYGPWVEALLHYIEHAPEEVLRVHVDEHGGELERLIPTLGPRVGGVPPPRESDPETERYMLWGAVTGLLEQASRDELIVLVLDDLHWADKETLSLLKRLVSSGAGMRLLVLGTYRDSDLTRSHPLTELLAALRREQGVERIQLSGLEDPDIVALMQAAAGHEMDATGQQLAHEIAGETDGNPFFVAEMLRHLVESGALYRGDDGRWALRGSLSQLGLPQSVREVVGGRIERLGDAAHGVLSCAAVIGRDFDLELLVRVVEQGEDELLDVLDKAVEAAVLVERSDRPGSFTFAHALISHTLYEEFGATRRARMHRRVGEALEGICGDDTQPRLGELALHWAQATTAVDHAKAVDYSRRAGERALSELAPDEALRWFTQALELLGQAGEGDAADRCELLIGLGEAQRQVGEADFRETLLEAAATARQLGDDDRLTRAALANTRGFTSEMGRVDEERVEMLEAAAARLQADAPRRADVLALLAMELSFGEDTSRRMALAQEALGLARARADEDTLMRVIDRYLFATWLPERLAERLELSAQLLERADHTRDPFRRLLAYNRRIYYVLEDGDAEEADGCVRSMLEIADKVPQPFLRWVALYQAGMMAHLHGRLDAAEALIGDAVAVGTDGDQPDAVLFYAGQLCLLRYDQGRVDEVLDLVEQSVEDNPGLPAWRGFHASALCDLGRGDEARAMLADEHFKALPQDFLRLAGLAVWADACANLGAAEFADDLYGLLEPFRKQVINNGVGVHGAVSHFLGRLAATAGDHDRAGHDFEAAAATHRRLDAPVMLARTEEAWARSLLDRGRADDHARASALLESALVRSRDHGADGIARSVEAAVT